MKPNLHLLIIQNICEPIFIGTPHYYKSNTTFTNGKECDDVHGWSNDKSLEILSLRNVVLYYEDINKLKIDGFPENIDEESHHSLIK